MASDKTFFSVTAGRKTVLACIVFFFCRLPLKKLDNAEKTA